MNAEAWLACFRRHLPPRPEPDWTSPNAEAPETRKLLGESLARFQLGETGTGSCLLRGAKLFVTKLEPQDQRKAYVEALEHFLAEEAEHTRLLALLCKRFGASLLSQHWTHTLFRSSRRAFGFHFEVQMLVTAELIGAAYFQMIERHTLDRPLRFVCRMLLDDEARHIAFHSDHLRDVRRGLTPLEAAAWDASFQSLCAVARRLAWFDHGSALRAIGVEPEDFNGEAVAWMERILASVRKDRSSVPESFVEQSL